MKNNGNEEQGSTEDIFDIFCIPYKGPRKLYIMSQQEAEARTAMRGFMLMLDKHQPLFASGRVKLEPGY
jgi:hypothetical protein